MKIMGMGLNYATGELLIPPVTEVEFGNKIQNALTKNAEEVRDLARASTAATTFRGEVERERLVDIGDPRAAGWTFLVNRDDPQLSEIIAALRPLAEHRGMEDPSAPLTYGGEDWWEWYLDYYTPLETDTLPHYILIVGGPDQVPFLFQSLLDSLASVGRVQFDSLDDLKAYVNKVIRLETADAPVVSRETLFFAADGGSSDPTYFSRLYMVEPMIQHVRGRFGMEMRTLIGDEATKANLAQALTASNPALVYTASHGLGAPSENFEFQKKYNGALCCQSSGPLTLDDLFAADDVPLDQPFLEGSVFFQFACYGYGTPAESDYMHWLGNPELNAEADFVAALPKRLLAHPRGPVAFIGHVDTAWLHGFLDPDSPHIFERWDPRIAPFKRAVECLLQVQPAGLAMAEMNKRYDVGNALLTNAFDRLQRGRTRVTPEFQSRLASTFITRSDAQNYMIFGDPAARLRIPAE